jgi:hypothetical protein
MRGDAAAYQALGLEPGADQAAIDRAYRVLIKRYHPDREGGDAARASAINQAYFQLRRPGGQTADAVAPASVAEALYARRATQLKLRRQKKKARLWPLLLLAPLGILAYLQRDALSILTEDVQAAVQRLTEPSSSDGTDTARPGGPESLDEPLMGRAIADAVTEATALHRAGDEAALVENSRACHQKLRAEPSLERLDGCAAFDNAVLELQRHDPLRDEGPFGASAITARQISGATLLSNDYLAIEARLDRVRSRVQLLLAPPEQQARSGDLNIPQVAP